MDPLILYLPVKWLIGHINSYNESPPSYLPLHRLDVSLHGFFVFLYSCSIRSRLAHLDNHQKAYLRLTIPDQDRKLSQHNPSPVLRSSEVARMSMQRSLLLMLDDPRGIASGTLRIINICFRRCCITPTIPQKLLWTP